MRRRREEKFSNATRRTRIRGGIIRTRRLGKFSMTQRTGNFKLELSNSKKKNKKEINECIRRNEWWGEGGYIINYIMMDGKEG